MPLPVVFDNNPHLNPRYLRDRSEFVDSCRRLSAKEDQLSLPELRSAAGGLIERAKRLFRLQDIRFSETTLEGAKALKIEAQEDRESALSVIARGLKANHDGATMLYCPEITRRDHSYAMHIPDQKLLLLPDSLIVDAHLPRGTWDPSFPHELRHLKCNTNAKRGVNMHWEAVTEDICFAEWAGEKIDLTSSSEIYTYRSQIPALRQRAVNPTQVIGWEVVDRVRANLNDSGDTLSEACNVHMESLERVVAMLKSGPVEFILKPGISPVTLSIQTVSFEDNSFWRHSFLIKKGEPAFKQLIEQVRTLSNEIKDSLAFLEEDDALPLLRRCQSITRACKKLHSDSLVVLDASDPHFAALCESAFDEFSIRNSKAAAVRLIQLFELKDSHELTGSNRQTYAKALLKASEGPEIFVPFSCHSINAAFRAGLYSEAVEASVKLLKGGETIAGIHNLLGNSLLEIPGQETAALKSIRRARRLDPSEPEFAISEAYSLERLKQPREALKILRPLRKQAPHLDLVPECQVEIFLQMSSCYKALGLGLHASQYLKKAEMVMEKEHLREEVDLDFRMASLLSHLKATLPGTV